MKYVRISSLNAQYSPICKLGQSIGDYEPADTTADDNVIVRS